MNFLRVMVGMLLEVNLSEEIKEMYLLIGILSWKFSLLFELKFVCIVGSDWLMFILLFFVWFLVMEIWVVVNVLLFKVIMEFVFWLKC